jgi:DNA-binding response OmpR family regulator
MMPGISGFEVLKQLKSNQLTSHIPVVLLTAKGDTQSRIRGWSENADEYLEKPFNSVELLTRIESLLTVRSLLRHRYQREFTAPEPVEKVIETEQEPAQSLNSVNQAFMDKINGILERHYSDESLDVGFLAKEMAMSHRQLGRKMKSLLDLTPAESIRSFRLKKAALLLTEGATPSVVAFDVGFTSHSYFGQCFKAQYNCLPSAYQKE